jgi:hypothetical protein
MELGHGSLGRCGHRDRNDSAGRIDHDLDRDWVNDPTGPFFFIGASQVAVSPSSWSIEASITTPRGDPSNLIEVIPSTFR